MQLKMVSHSKSDALFSLFDSNFFYGICVVALIIETVLRLQLNNIGILPLTLAFVLTVLFYNYPRQKRDHTRRTQTVLGAIFLVVFFCVVARYHNNLGKATLLQALAVLVFPLVGILYYGFQCGKYTWCLRQFGCLKPFVIGFVWAGITTVFPVLYDDVVGGKSTVFSMLAVHLFIKNMMFVTLLAILFDVKDMVSDNGANLKTIVLKLGVKRLVHYVMIPLSTIGLIIYSVFAYTRDFTVLAFLINLIPYCLLFLVFFITTEKKNLLFYYVFVDGLLLIKAFTGIIFMIVV